jgi:hypothetical protein
MLRATPPQPSYANEYRTRTPQASVRLGSLGRLVCLGRPFTKPCNLPDETVELAARRHRHDQWLAVRCRDYLSRLPLVPLVNHQEAA